MLDSNYKSPLQIIFSLLICVIMFQKSKIWYKNTNEPLIKPSTYQEDFHNKELTSCSKLISFHFYVAISNLKCIIHVRNFARRESGGRSTPSELSNNRRVIGE